MDLPTFTQKFRRLTSSVYDVSLGMNKRSLYKSLITLGGASRTSPIMKVAGNGVTRTSGSWLDKRFSAGIQIVLSSSIIQLLSVERGCRRPLTNYVAIECLLVRLIFASR